MKSKPINPYTALLEVVEMKTLSQSDIETLPKKRSGRPPLVGPPKPRHVWKNRNKEHYGMRCPKCTSQDVYVLDSRGHKRRRACRGCGNRFTTVEVIVGDVTLGGAGTALDKFIESEARKRLKQTLQDLIK